MLQLIALAAISITAAAYVDHRDGQVAADLAAERLVGQHVTVPVKKAGAAAPVGVEIPRLRIRSSLVDLRKQADGSLQVPTDPARAGWYVGSSHPGDPGPTVLAGHVDSYTGPGVFYRLDRMRAGDLVLVRRADGTSLRFVVTRVIRTSKRAFPTQLVYVGDARPSLRLITCGGVFDRRTKHYLDNVVVLAVPATA